MTISYHFLVESEEQCLSEDNSTLIQINQEDNNILNWHHVAYPLLNNLNSEDHSAEITLYERKKTEAFKNLPYKKVVDSNQKILIEPFHPNKNIIINNSEFEFNYAEKNDTSSIIPIDLDNETLSSLENIGVNLNTVEGAEEFYYLFGEALNKFISTLDITEEEKERLRKKILINK